MAVIARSTNPTPSPSGPVDGQNKVGSGLICGEDITAGAPCYIASNGLVMMSGGNGVTALTDPGAQVHGWAPRATKFAQGDPITLVTDVDFGYSSGMTPGTKFYIDVSAAIKGRLNDSVGVASSRPCAFAIDQYRIRVFQVLY